MSTAEVEPVGHGRQGGQVTRVRLHRGVRVRVVSEPYTSVLALACAGVRDQLLGRRSPASRVTASLAPGQRGALARLVVPGSSVGPEFLGPPEPSTDMSAELDRLRDLSATELQDDFAETYRGQLPPHWRRIAEQPRRWVFDTVDALARLWTIVEPVWWREEALRARHDEWVGSAAERGLLDSVLAELHPRGWAEDGVLVFPDPEGTDVDARSRAVLLAPMFSSVDVSISNLERPDVVRLAYPVRLAAAPDQGGLSALLTPIRARLLRLLDREQTMTQVARAAGLSPAAANHQIETMVHAGLVDRHRDGRSVIVRRSARGTGLLTLYGLGSDRV
ncbi:MAG: helix-turn-helix domain-containing protein [Pseudonocardia sp.]